MKKRDAFIIGLVQHRSASDVASNYKIAEEGIRKAHRMGAQIICLQELFRSYYFCTIEEHKNFELSEELTGETLNYFQPIAKELDVVLVLPIFEKRAVGVYHNSAVVLDADGSDLGVYRKMHIPDDPLFYEKFYFAPGDSEEVGEGFKVFQTKYADIGVLICWDQWYPEAARLTALKGAEVIFYPTAIGWHPSEKSEHGKKQLEAWQTIQRSHAVANGVYVASVNRTGHEETPGTDGIEFFGNSFITDPFGEVLVQAGAEEEVLVQVCERKLIEETRQHWPFLRDRRIDAYEGVLKRYGK